MSKEYYKGIDKIKFEGRESDNPWHLNFIIQNK